MSLNGTVWAPIGPSPMLEPGSTDNGLVTCVAVNPNNQNVLYLGGAQGGVWRSRDAGSTWTPLFDHQPALGIGEPAGIAIDPANTDTIYVGTSGRLGSNEPDTIRQNAAGLFKSTDGGASWIALGSGFPAGNTGNANQFANQTQSISVIIVDPVNGTIYLASTRGVFTSTDGGLNWATASGIAADTRSLALDLSTPPSARILYAGVSGQGVFQSSDGGRNFTQILSATTPAVATALGGAAFTRVVVALAPPTSPANVRGVQVIYATMAGAYGAPTDPIGLFLSIDQGSTWTKQAATGMGGTTYGGYSLAMAVDPASPGDGATDTVYYGCLTQFVSTDAGATFTAHSAGHADTHTYSLVTPTGGGSTVIYCGSDGGIDVSSNGGITWTSLNSGSLQIGLFYNIAVKPDATASVTVGALQDNKLETTAGGPPGLAWNAPVGGDGWDVAYDGASPPVLYGAYGGPATSIFSSPDDGQTYPTNVSPPWTAVDTGGANPFLLNQIAADPSASGLIYASGAQNLWQRRSGTWRIIAAIGSTGNVDVAPANGNNVVIAAGSQVFVSTNALAPTAGAPSGVIFTNITRNLPARNVARAVFDPIDPTVIYAVLTGFSNGTGQNVFRTTVAATAWTNISPAVDIPCGAIAVDGTTTPSTLFVGTDFGVLRSMDGGASWTVLDDIHFPRVPVFDLAFNPTAGVLRAGTYGRGVFTFTTPTGPAIAVGLQDELAFGRICAGPQFLTITVYNVGATNLIVFNVQVLMGSSDFTVLATPPTPVTIDPGEDVTFTVRFNPTSTGVNEQAIIRITSNDPTAPFVDVLATGSKGTGRLVTAIADAGNFGNVCQGTFADEPLVLNNAGQCPLSVFAITATPGDFQAPSVASFPIVIAPGASVDVPLRFQPTALGARNGTVTVFSDDPASPKTIAVSGFAPAPRLALAIADSGSFGACCVGSFKDEPLILSNTGGCTLSVAAIAVSDASFLLPEVLSYPLTIEAGDAISLPIRFAPTALGPASATITVTSNDPASPTAITVSGTAPPGRLAVTGSTMFGGVKCCRREQRRVSICNVGDCTLHVRRIALRRWHRHFRLLHNPFPAPLHPGSCLDVVIQYHATERAARGCELVIESDDPTDPVRCIDVVAWTIWDCCEEKHCCKCREEKREPCCECHKRRGKACDDDDHDHDQEMTMTMTMTSATMTGTAGTTTGSDRRGAGRAGPPPCPAGCGDQQMQVPCDADATSPPPRRCHTPPAPPMPPGRRARVRLNIQSHTPPSPDCSTTRQPAPRPY